MVGILLWTVNSLELYIHKLPFCSVSHNTTFDRTNYIYKAPFMTLD